MNSVFDLYTFPSSHFNWNQSMRPVDRQKKKEMVFDMLTKATLRGMQNLLQIFTKQ